MGLERGTCSRISFRISGSFVKTRVVKTDSKAPEEIDTSQPLLSELVRAAKAGSREAYSDIIRQMDRTARAVAFARTGDLEAAVEILQEAWMKAYTLLDRLREPERFPAWFAAIVTNLATDRARRRRTEEAARGRLEQEWKPGSATPDRPESLLQLVQELEPGPRALIVLRFMGDLSYREIADLLGIPINRVKWGIQSSFQELRRRFGERP